MSAPYSNQGPRRGRGRAINNRARRGSSTKRYGHQYDEGELSIPPPPPPNINPSEGRNQSSGLRVDHQITARPNPAERRRGTSVNQGGQRGRGGRARTPPPPPPPGFDEDRRPRQTPNTSRVGNVRGRGNSLNNTDGNNRGEYRRNSESGGNGPTSHTSPSSNTSRRNQQDYYREPHEHHYHHHNEQRRRDSPAIEGPTTMHGLPQPSTSYASDRPSQILEHRRSSSHNIPYASHPNLPLPTSSRSATTSYYEGESNIRPRHEELKVSADGTSERIKDDRRGYNRSSDQRGHYSTADSNPENKSDERKQYEASEHRVDKRVDQTSGDNANYKNSRVVRGSNPVNTRANEYSNRRSSEQDVSADSRQRNSSNKSIEERESSPINERDSLGRVQSSERDLFSSNRNDPNSHGRGNNEGDRKSPLMSQKEAFKKRQEDQRMNKEDTEPKRGRNAQDERFKTQFREPNCEPNRSPRTAESSQVYKTSKRPVTPPSMQKHNSPSMSKHLQPIEDSYSSHRRSSPPGHQRRLSENRTKRLSPRPSTSNQEKSFQHNRCHSSFSSSKEGQKYEKGGSDNYNRTLYTNEKRSYESHQSKEWKQGRSKYDSQQNDERRSHQNVDEHDRKLDSHGEARGTKRKYSEDANEYPNSNKKGKHQPGIQRKERNSVKSTTYREDQRGITPPNENKHVAAKDHNTHRDSDVDSISSAETKRVSALARLGPKLTMHQRLSKLPKQKEDYNKEHSINDSIGASCSSPKEVVALCAAVDNTLAQKQENSDNSKGVQGSSGMQITIRKGPDDQTERVVNSDDSNQWNKVNFGDKKYIKLKCPHCETVCVTFNEYGSHFQKEVHTDAIKRVKLRLQQGLQMMRKKQRENQKKLDSAALDASKDESVKKGGAERSGYCKVCKLLFKHQNKTEHEETEFHKKIVMFLYPSCNVCKVPKFFSPMAYEKHIATLGHIKKRSKTEEVDKELEDVEKSQPEESTDSDLIFGEFDPDEFEILDEVGEEDDSSEERRNEENLEAQAASKPNQDDLSQKGSTIEQLESSGGENFSIEIGFESEDRLCTLSDRSNKGEMNEESRKIEAIEARNKTAIEVTELNNLGPRKDIKDERAEPKCDFDTPMGEQYVRKVEMLYCDLCHKYLPRIEPEKDIQCLLRDHCLTRGHQNAYLRKQKELLEENLKHSEQQVCRLQSKGIPFNTTDEDQLDFEAEDSISAADTLSMNEDEMTVG